METSKNIIALAEAYVESFFKEEVSSDYVYHNFKHTSNVANAARQLAEAAEIGEEESEVLVLASLFHDIGFGVDPENHEFESERLARKFLRKHNFPESKIDLISKCIMATKKEWKGKDRLCCLMKDADLSGLASPNYSKIAENLRKEISATNGMEIDRFDWLQENIKFVQNHSYFTEEGKKLFNKGKEANLNSLKKLENEKKSKKKDKLLTIGSSKSAQTQLKTALRNHIDLSSIADNKANIMLSVNAIVITVGIPILVDKSYTHPDMIIPTSILAVASLISMIFATLSTRPAKMSGITNQDMIQSKKSNLFFFGNYFKMNFEDYEEGMRTVVGDNEILDNSITRDLFYLGKSLGNKYEYLRWCYNIFMYGIALAMLSFLVVNLA